MGEYYLTSDELCEPTVCGCDNGVAATYDEGCTVHDANLCVSCDAGYRLSGTDCVAETTCTCANGQEATLDDCPVSEENCVSCDAGYELNGQVCEEVVVPVSANVCSCPDGPAAEGDACHTDGAVICTRCYHVGFKLLDDATACEPKVCRCDNGYPLTDGACIDENYRRCIACEDGYRMNSNWIGPHQVDTCEIIPICTCDNGVAADGDDCTVNNAEVCASCDAFPLEHWYFS